MSMEGQKNPGAKRGQIQKLPGAFSDDWVFRVAFIFARNLYGRWRSFQARPFQHDMPARQTRRASIHQSLSPYFPGSSRFRTSTSRNDRRGDLPQLAVFAQDLQFLARTPTIRIETGLQSRWVINAG
jgi:hypothetical protein